MADIHKVYLSSLFLAYLLQFQNPVLLSSPLLSILIGSVLARYFQVEFALPELNRYIIWINYLNIIFLILTFNVINNVFFIILSNILLHNVYFLDLKIPAHLSWLYRLSWSTVFLLQQNMKKGPLVARVLKLTLHLHLVFTTSITFNYLIKVTLQHVRLKDFFLICVVLLKHVYVHV